MKSEHHNKVELWGYGTCKMITLTNSVHGAQTRRFSPTFTVEVNQPKRHQNLPTKASMAHNGFHSFCRYFPVAKRDRDWGLFITTAGESHHPAGTPYPDVGHPKSYDFRALEGRILHEHQIIYISAGRGWFKSAASKKRTIEAGTVLVLFPGVWHSFAPDQSTGWNEHWVGFNGDIAGRLIRHGFFMPTRAVQRGVEEDRLLALFRDIRETAQSNHPAMQQVMSSATFRLLALLYSTHQSKLSGDDPGLQIIHKVVNRLREAGDTGVASMDLPDLAKEFNVSHRWLRRAFAHHTGLSPHQYFLEIRLARARYLLTQTSLPIKEIAARVGFEDAEYFWKFFHLKVGAPPGAWRVRAQKDNSS